MHGATLVPWAWGMNGVFSVVGSTLVIIISMASTFTMAMACAALFYAIAAFVAAGLYEREAVQTAAAVNMSPL
jgi:Sec-independent protein secretion pathway component TatC